MNNSFNVYHTQVLLEKRFSKDSSCICKDFVKFCKHHIGLNSTAKIKFLAEREGNITTGCYMPATGKIKILTKDRALIDVLRSIAHELVHQKQHNEGQLHDTSGETGSDHENEANIKAGIIMRLYQDKNRDKIY